MSCACVMPAARSDDMMRRAEVAQCDVRLTLELLSEGERDVRLADTRL
jgi:hypothetical protein